MTSQLRNDVVALAIIMLAVAAGYYSGYRTGYRGGYNRALVGASSAIQEHIDGDAAAMEALCTPTVQLR